MRGGSGCPYNKNLGEQFTLRPYNNLSGPNKYLVAKYASENGVAKALRNSIFHIKKSWKFSRIYFSRFLPFAKNTTSRK